MKTLPARAQLIHPLDVGSDDDVGATESVALAAAPFMTRGVELSGLLTTMVDTAVELLGAERGTLYLVDGATRKLTSVVAHLPELERIALSFGQGVAGRVAETGDVANVGEPDADPDHDRSFDAKTGFRTHSMLALPLRDDTGETIGVLQLLNARRGRFGKTQEDRAVELGQQIGRVLQSTSLYASLRRKASIGDARPPLAFAFNQVVGESPPMRRVYELVRKAARTDATVLVVGETGTGKELVARAVHVNSGRREGPFVKVDCTTLPETLVENELFGHERGAFTGADRATSGRVERADGGTLFLDEIGELPLPLQGKLLRLLQDREYERVGGRETRRVDVRFVCATHRDLPEMVARGEFREDLLYRLRVVPVELPPLRARGRDDLHRLVEHFVTRYGERHGRPIRRVEPGALAALEAHPFPGNVRELEHCIESAVVLCDGDAISEADLPLVRRGGAVRVGDPTVSLEALERAHLIGVLEACDGNRSEAARRLGIGRNTLSRKLEDIPGS